MLLKDLIKQGTATISAAYPEREAREMVFAYLAWAIGTQRHTHIVDPEYIVPDEVAEKARNAFDRMAASEPLQYVTGQADFYGRTFKVNPSVLIPRPETELLCREAIERISGLRDSSPDSGNRFSNMKIADLCTGSGCIAWTMALEYPEAKVVAVDISDGALETASSQNFQEEPAGSPCFIKSDVLDVPRCCEAILQASGSSAKFDMILSNPPYVKDSEKALMRENVLDHEPHLALFVPDDDALRFYEAVASIASELLSSDGFGIVEINEALGPETQQVFSDAGFSKTAILKDLSDKDRFVIFSSLHG